MNRIDRLFAITLRLQTKKRIQARDIAEQFDISERTVYRDMQALIEMGLPIASLPGEGYEWIQSANLPPIRLSADEATALFLAGELFITNSTGDMRLNAEMALDKISAILPDSTHEQIKQWRKLIDFFPFPMPFNIAEPYLITMIDAIQTHRVLHMHYQAYMQAEISKRDIEPMNLTYDRGAWYVTAYCHLREDMRSFRLNRIQALNTTERTFTPRIMIEDSATIPVIVRIRFDEHIIRHVHERQHYGYIENESDDIFTYQVHNLREIQQWVMGFGASAEVLSPNELREWILEEAKILIKLLT